MDKKTVMQEAILNGLYSQDYPGHNLLTPQLVTNQADGTIWQTLQDELQHASTLPGRLPLSPPICWCR